MEKSESSSDAVQDQDDEDDDDASTEKGDDDEDDTEEEADNVAADHTGQEDPQSALDEFRAAWRREVRSGDRDVRPAGNRRDQDQTRAEHAQDEDVTLQKAVGLFHNGVRLEREGDLYAAIQSYRRAVQLVPDVERRAFEDSRKNLHNVNANQERNEDFGSFDPNGNENEAEPSFSGSQLECGEEDLCVRFIRLRVSAICTPNDIQERSRHKEEAGRHIGCLPPEVFVHVLRWVVTRDVDLVSLEACALVCRGFYLAARSDAIWRQICVSMWGWNSVANGCGTALSWREHFISRPRVRLDGCYVAKMSYVREGERGFQDSVNYRSWHMVTYFRYFRFFSGGLVLMAVSAEEPKSIIKLLASRKSAGTLGLFHGHYRVVANRIACVLTRPSAKPKQQRPNRRNSVADWEKDTAEQEFRMELDVCGPRFRKLSWAAYQVVTLFKRGPAQQQVSTNITDMDVTNANAFPAMRFHLVPWYQAQTAQEPLL